MGHIGIETNGRLGTGVTTGWARTLRLAVNGIGMGEQLIGLGQDGVMEVVGVATKWDGDLRGMMNTVR